MTAEQLDKLNSFLHSRYTHWSSTMRLEMIDRIKQLEKEIETKYFKAMIPAQPFVEPNEEAPFD